MDDLEQDTNLVVKEKYFKSFNGYPYENILNIFDIFLIQKLFFNEFLRGPISWHVH